MGLVQCIALVPGVSRSGATISAGLLRGLDRVAATRLSFFLSIPALLAAGLFELKDALGTGGVGFGPTAVATLVSFVVAYASVAWLLRFVAGNSIGRFVPYRVGARRRPARRPGDRRDDRHLRGGYSQPDFLKNR